MTLSDQQFYKLVDLNVSEPIPLRKADLSLPFAYFRGFGVFYVPSGLHMVLTSYLYIWAKGFEDMESFKESIEDKDVYFKHGLHETLADKFLNEIEGSAISSSVGNHILIGTISNLNEEEKQVFSSYDIKEILI